MGLFADGFKELKKASEPLYKAPKSIQETIEIMAVAENGIFEVARNRYSKCYRFQDINYTTATEDEQIGIFERYCKFLNSLDCNFKITVNNKNKNMIDLRNNILLAYCNDGYDNFRKIYNDIIEEKIREGRQGIEQERYLTITIERKNFEEAKAQFATLEATIHKAFIELGAEIIPLSGDERIKVLYDYYHLGDENSFNFSIKEAKKVGADFKNDLCNGMIKFFPDHFEDESKFCRALFIKKYPSSLSDRFINEITSLPVHTITSIDVVPVPKDLTTKTLQKKYLGIESDIIKQQRVRNKNNDFSTEISYAKRTEKREIEAIMDDVRENDQCLFYVGVTIIVMAESKKELDSICETIETIGKRNSCTIDTHYLKQRANGVYELCAYVDSMTKKVEDMTDEISALRDYIQKMEDDKLTNKLKKSLNEAADRLENRCEEIKQQLFEVKESIKNKASDIMADFKMRGKEALNRVSEFVGLKEKLTGIRDKVKEGIADTNRILAKIDAFGKGMREAGQQMANTFRTFADKEEVDYSKKEQKFSKTELAKKPWQWQKKVYETMVLHLDASIDKVEDLSRDVELNRMKDKQVEEPNVDYSKDILPVGAVAETSEYQYGADAFEAAYPKMKQDKAMDVKTPAVPKTGKVR